MRSVATALAVIACWGLSGLAQEKKDDAKPYKSEQGKFSIQFPGGSKEPKRESKNANEGVMHAVIADFGDGKKCAVIYMDVTGLTPALVKDLFDSAEKTAVTKEGEKVTSKDSEFGKDKLPCREFVVASKDKTRQLRTRMIVSGTRVYTIVIGDAKSFATSGEADRVLDSFEITK